MLQLPDSEQSLWRESYPEQSYARLTAEIEVDVAVIGAGITGLTTAYLLKQVGKTVAVLDKATVGGGTSGRTTGKVTSQHNLIYDELTERLGIEQARAYAEINQAAVEKVAAIVKAEKLDCGWQMEDNYVYTTEPDKVESFRRETRAASSLGLPAVFQTESPLPFEIAGAVKFTGQATFNAQQYLLGLAEKVHGDGSYVFETSNVSRVHENDVRVWLSTAHGKVRAKKLVVATNVPTLPLLARGEYCFFEYPQESYIVAARVPKKLSGMYISPDKDQYSILPVTLAGKPGVLVGGLGRLSALRGRTVKHYRKLADYAEQHFNATEIVYRWSDRDYLSYDRLPLIGKLYPWSEHMYVGAAYSKWGLSNGTAAGMILTDMITGKGSRYAEIFEPHRRQVVAGIPGAIKRYLG
jgi:glycine/D-amino acid oxidase-like deaminating enzyme